MKDANAPGTNTAARTIRMPDPRPQIIPELRASGEAKHEAAEVQPEMN